MEANTWSRRIDLEHRLIYRVQLGYDNFGNCKLDRLARIINMSEPNFLDQALNLAKTAGIDTSDLIDGVASKIPGGDAVAQLLKTGLSMAGNEEADSEAGEAESDTSEQDA